MRKIINSTYMTLDGVVENPHMWPTLPLDDSRVLSNGIIVARYSPSPIAS